MRKVGYTLLLVGFAWILWMQVAGLMHGGIRSVLAAQYVRLDADRTKRYSVREVEERILNTANETYSLFPLVIAPGILMLVGGLLVGSRRRAKETNGV